MSPTIHLKSKYFHCTVQTAEDSRQKFHFCRLPFDVTSCLTSLIASVKFSVDCSLRRDLSVRGCSMVVKYLDSWCVGDPQNDSIGRIPVYQVCAVSVVRKVSVVVALSTSVGSSVVCRLTRTITQYELLILLGSKPFTMLLKVVTSISSD